MTAQVKEAQEKATRRTVTKVKRNLLEEKKALEEQIRRKDSAVRAYYSSKLRVS
jgi:hypothetical protein